MLPTTDLPRVPESRPTLPRTLSVAIWIGIAVIGAAGVEAEDLDGDEP